MVAIVVVVAAALVGWFFLRAWTVAQVYGLDRFQAGSQLTVAGTITGIHRETTSYGPRVALSLDDDGTCVGVGNVFGDPNASYQLGQSFQTTLHFQAVTVNGDPGVSAPELVCPFPGLLRAISQVVDAVGLVAGILLAYNGTDAGGWTHYEIVTTNGDAYRADVLPVTLRKSLSIQGMNPALPARVPVDSAARWKTWASVQYLQVSAGFIDAPAVDRMASLASVTSQNGTLRFVDTNGNGLVDDGDRLDVRLTATASPSSWDTYMIVIGGFDPPDRQYVDGFHYLLNGPSGVLEVPLPKKEETHLQLRYRASTAGPPVTSQIVVGRVPIATGPAIQDVKYYLGTASGSDVGNLSSLPSTLAGGGSMAFADVNGDGRLDTGDSFLVGGMQNRTSVSLMLQVPGRSIGYLSWLVGYGPPVGSLPIPTLQFQGTNPWTATATVSYWSPALVIGGTLQVGLAENATALFTNVTLTNGTVATFAGGSLSFTDTDKDGFVSTGDRFVLQGNPTSQYRMTLSVLFSAWAIAWTP